MAREWSRKSIEEIFRNYFNKHKYELGSGGSQSFGEINAEAILPANWQQFYLAERERVELYVVITDIYARYMKPRSQIVTEMSVSIVGTTTFAPNEMIARLFLIEFSQPVNRPPAEAFLNAIIASASPKIERVEHVGPGIASEFSGMIGHINAFEPKNLSNGLGVKKPYYLTLGPDSHSWQCLAIRAGATGYTCTRAPSSYDKLIFTHTIETVNKNSVVIGDRIKFAQWPNFLFKLKE